MERVRHIDVRQDFAFKILPAAKIEQRTVARVCGDANPNTPLEATALTNLELCTTFNLQPSGLLVLLCEHVAEHEFIPTFLVPNMCKADWGIIAAADLGSTHGQTYPRVGCGTFVLEFFAWPKRGKIVVPLSARSKKRQHVIFQEV